MSPAHRAYIRLDTVISAVINMTFTTGFFFALFGSQPQVSLWGAEGLVLKLLAAAVISAIVTPMALRAMFSAR